MNTVLKNAIAAMACLALAAIAFFCIQGALFFADLRSTVTRIGADVQASVEHVNTVTLPSADRSIAELQATVKRSGLVLNQSRDLLKNVDRRISDTSQNVNAILLQAGIAADQVRIASTEQTHYWKRISADTDLTLKSLNQGARGMNENMLALHALLADPKLRDAVDQADGILADAHAMTSDGKSAFHRFTKPPTKKQIVLTDAKDVGGLSYLLLKIIQLLP